MAKQHNLPTFNVATVLNPSPPKKENCFSGDNYKIILSIARKSVLSIFNTNAYIYLKLCNSGFESLSAEVAYLTSGLTCNNQFNNNRDGSITILVVDRRNLPRGEIC